MIQSMTGYAAKTRDIGCGALQIELRGVNSRFLDLHFRIHDDLRALETPLRELLTKRIARGKVECRLFFNVAAGKREQDGLMPEKLHQLRVLQAKVHESLPDAAPLSVAQVLQWPGIFGDDTIDLEAISAPALEMAAEALADFTASRAREGEKLSAIILQNVTRIRAVVTEVAPLIPQAQATFAEKLRQRLLEAINTADDERIRQEVAVFANRIDVAEELARLNTHLDEVERVLKHGGAAGKRLDFLMQELNREANTLGSKSAVTAVSQASMELKLLIEQMREQIQNLE
ncbi:MAG: hypothetical protein H6R18_1377 [Proteobacteria bacterium]|nr:hypothetical protein [Pseudomonadota bacterium]